jgi:hypothetical protein
MSFLADLFRWFRGEKTAAKNEPQSPLVSTSLPEPDIDEFKVQLEDPRLKLKKDLDLEPRLTSQDVMGDLQSLQSLTQQFDRARQELVAELQKLAPPKKRNPFWDKDAA